MRELGAPEEAVQETLAGYRLLCEEVAPVDAAVALAALEIGRRTPRRLPLVGALIAAAAQAQGAVLVHRDEHLRAIPTDLLRQKDLAGC